MLGQISEALDSDCESPLLIGRLVVAEQSGVFAGKGGFDIRVTGATDLKGGVIASEASAGLNRLETGKLTASIHPQNSADPKLKAMISDN
jgi:hypothetical protein